MIAYINGFFIDRKHNEKEKPRNRKWLFTKSGLEPVLYLFRKIIYAIYGMHIRSMIYSLKSQVHHIT